MARNQLPEGVGKKIVEALKKQAEADITPVTQPETNSLDAETPVLNDVDFDDFKDAAPASNTSGAANTAKPAASFDITFKPDDAPASQSADDAFQSMSSGISLDMQGRKDDIFAQSSKESFSNTMFNVQNSKKDDAFAKTPKESFSAQAFNIPNKQDAQQDMLFKPSSDTPAMSFGGAMQTPGMLSYSGIPFTEEQKVQPAAPAVNISIPTNVAVLKNLIASLPVGVTKQTGAQIIRQTLEAMGLPMASVLKEAQEVQEELNTNTRECMLKIQEFKTNIMQLEQSVQEYQKNMTQINDLVSLFLLTDRK